MPFEYNCILNDKSVIDHSADPDGLRKAAIIGSYLKREVFKHQGYNPITKTFVETDRTRIRWHTCKLDELPLIICPGQKVSLVDVIFEKAYRSSEPICNSI